MVNHRRPLHLKELHSTGETIVWRDPGGSWACLPPVYICVWNHPATGCDMWTTPKRRETLGNANQNKTTKRAGYKKVYELPVPWPTPPQSIFRIKGALWNAEQNKNTNNNSKIEDGQRKKPQNEPVKLERSPMKTTMKRTEPYKLLKRTTKPLRRRVLIEEGLA